MHRATGPPRPAAGSDGVTVDRTATAFLVRGLTKRFGGVLAVDNVDLTVLRGEVHGVIGRNGAGKSVLTSMIAGLVPATRGELTVGTTPVTAASYTPATAHRLGVSMITQEPTFATQLTVVDNVFLGIPQRHRGLLDHTAMRTRTTRLIERLGLDISPNDRMTSISIEDQQLLAFGKAVFIERAAIVLLDEITASLSRARKQQLLELMRAEATESGRAFILISHHISEVLEFCDRISVMRDGRRVATLQVPGTTAADLVGHIVGDHPVEVPPAADRRLGAPVLEADRITDGTTFAPCDLVVREREIVGLAGLDGSGKDALIDSLFGLHRLHAGQIRVAGRPVRPHSPRAALRAGFAYLAKKREEMATIQHRSVAENILASVYGRLRTPWGTIDRTRAAAMVDERLARLPVKMTGPDADIDSLSGGNRQKVMINRLATTHPRVFLLCEPTRGVDIATKPDILAVVRDELAADAAVLVTSESEDELVMVCDRILVFFRGEIVAELRRGEPDFTPTTLYRLIQGVAESSTAEAS